VIEPRRATLEAKVPLGRLGDKDDFKGIAVFLASEASRYITGTVLWADGGILA
jgi:NAD(P)-dependent dehydrogenase (short-subunit alcohol dehydrogenase family)